MKQEIIDIINKDFSEDERAFVIEQLSSIKLTHVMVESEMNLENTLFSILRLANGNVSDIAELTEVAKIDFRDVIYWTSLLPQKNIINK